MNPYALGRERVDVGRLVESRVVALEVADAELADDHEDNVLSLR